MQADATRGMLHVGKARSARNAKINRSVCLSCNDWWRRRIEAIFTLAPPLLTRSAEIDFHSLEPTMPTCPNMPTCLFYIRVPTQY